MARSSSPDLKEKLTKAHDLLKEAMEQARSEEQGQLAAFLRVALSYVRAALEGLGKK